jgi:hypothetical protein
MYKGAFTLSAIALTVFVQPARADFIQIVWGSTQQLVLENSTGGAVITYTLSDLAGPGPVQVAGIGTGIFPPTPGDYTREVVRNPVVLTDGCTNTMLRAGVMCVFTVGFSVADLDPFDADPTVDSATWTITTNATFAGLGQGLSMSSTVTVTDCGAPAPSHPSFAPADVCPSIEPMTGVVGDDIAPIPEPSFAPLLASGLVGLLGYGWRRRNRLA